ncbi:PREDICTED: uncharacterized protein LOC104825238 [Tarenaya hassleriana]|uniref:uncharacterized protein LOC104825238 n=1 Tax=Tarenaya hassleriana TaxID=28532 RepID=UPI00053C2F61|nr:PREDICTED: uncharacterized protein LOC104825238 [Tarenaya hassleriana]
MKTESVSILELELCDFITISKIQEADFICKATITGVATKNGWTYIGCGKYSRKLARASSSLVCQDTNAVRVIRFRVELIVDDGRDTTFFTVFDRDMTKLFNVRALETIETNVTHLSDTENTTNLPKCLENIIGKQLSFQIKVTPYNFSTKHHSFTMSHIFDDVSGSKECKTTGANTPQDIAQENSQQIDEDSQHIDESHDAKRAGKKQRFN